VRFQEVIDKDEAKTFEKVLGANVADVRHIRDKCPPDGPEGKCVGSQEGANLAILWGTLEITQEGIDQLPPELRIGPWAKPAVYDAVCRFNLFEKSYRLSMKINYDFERKDKYACSYDAASGYYGMDIHFSATYIEGDNSLTFENSHDVLALDEFGKGGICTKLGLLCCKTNPMLRILKATVANRDRYDHTLTIQSALNMPYNSKMPSACGEAAVKYSLVNNRKQCTDPGPHRPHDLLDHEISRNVLKQQLADEKVDDYYFDFRMQIATQNSVVGPIRAVEDPTLNWNEQTSVPVVLGRLKLLPRSHEKHVFALAPDEDALTLKFSPWNSPPEHRPLGNVGRCRRFVYHRHAAARERAFNLAPPVCPFASNV